MSRILKQYKYPSGAVNFGELFKIPVEERLTSLYEKDFLRANALVLAAVTTAFDRLNLKKKDYGNVINDIVEDIADNYTEDKISLEDLVLFLQKLARGEYGNVEEMSLARFTNLFEKYLDERWGEGIRIRDEKHEEFKTLGDDNYFERNNRMSPIAEEFFEYRKRAEMRRDEMALLKKENELLKNKK